MNSAAFVSFAETVKTAVSPALTARLLKARAGQGARVAPRLMQGAEAAATSGATTTAPGMRRLALSAGQDARAAQKAQGLASRSGVAPQRQALQARAQQDVTPLTQPMPVGKAGLTRGYSPAGRDFMTGHASYGDAVKRTAAMPPPPSAALTVAPPPRVAAGPTVAPPPRVQAAVPDAAQQGTSISGIRRRRQSGVGGPSSSMPPGMNKQAGPYANHSALNMGQAIRAMIDVPKNLFYAAIPPSTHHSKAELGRLEPGRKRDWFRAGLHGTELPK